MSGSAVVTNTFQNRTPSIPLSDLDQNFTDVLDYQNDPTNRNNFAVAGGSANTYSVTLSPPQTGGYTAGLEVTFKAANTNTGASVLNVNGIGAKSIVTITGTAVTAGQLSGIVKCVYNGSQFVAISASAAGGLTTAVADALYLRLDGTSPSYGLLVNTHTQTSGVITFDYSLGNVWQCALTQDGTVTIANASSAYSEMVMYFTQSGTATYSVGWTSAYKWPNGATHAMTGSSAAIDIVSVKSFNTGAVWLGDYSNNYS